MGLAQNPVPVRLGLLVNLVRAQARSSGLGPTQPYLRFALSQSTFFERFCPAGLVIAKLFVTVPKYDPAGMTRQKNASRPEAAWIRNRVTRLGELFTHWPVL
jgi:hypothetical protein